MIGWMPFSQIASENSSAPKRLPVSVIATAGILASFTKPASALIWSAPSDSE